MAESGPAVCGAVSPRELISLFFLGKTALIRFLARFTKTPLVLLNIHGGTTEEEILDTMAKAKEMARHHTRVYVFLDEMNTAPHLGLCSEIMCQRTVRGQPLPANVYMLAAVNPYRLVYQGHGSPADSCGLIGKQVHQASVRGWYGHRLAGPCRLFSLPCTRLFCSHILSLTDTKARLVYRVHPVPACMWEFVTDFGALSKGKESLYVTSMVSGFFHDFHPADRNMVVEAVSYGQDHVG